MPNLTLAVTDAQWTRVRAAFTTQDAQGNDVVPDEAAMVAWFKRQIRGKVQQYESKRRSPAATIASDLNAEGWNS